MPRSLKNEFISDQYTTLLHLSAVSLSASNITPVSVFDGEGNATSLALNMSGSGASISGQLSASTLNVANIHYPTQDGSVFDIIYTNGSKVLALTGVSHIMKGLGGFVTPGTYRNATITINSAGVISNITGTIAIRTFYYSLGVPTGLSFDNLEVPGERGVPTSSGVLTFISSVWSDAGVGDKANVVSFIRINTSIKTISTRSWAPDTIVYVYECEYTEAGWAIVGVRQTSSDSFN